MSPEMKAKTFIDTNRHQVALGEKLSEECDELLEVFNSLTFNEAKFIEECADVLEVMFAMAKYRGVRPFIPDLLQVATNKRTERGSFDQAVFLKLEQ